MKSPPERLGSFFLGSKYDMKQNDITGEIVNYDSRDLTTHAVCLGMTGSGKTGLCICLLEEAAIDQIPAIIIDPKGDITNHLLHFPELSPTDFLPWVNIDDARRKGLTPMEYSQYIAETWKKGLEKWGIGKERIKMLQSAVDFTIFTPGSRTGVPLNILTSLEAPNQQVDPENIRDLNIGLTGALLKLAGIDSDPVRDKEGVLLSSLIDHYWREDQNLTIEKIILSVQNPPFQKLGIFDIDTFYPEAQRIKLAMALNNLIASPSFREWLEGESLDINKIMYTKEGKPRHSIFYLAHLTDEEKMFFTTILLEKLSSWLQLQPGTTSLRGILYFDEVFGYMPPVAEPPTKKPLLRLLKQARAFGLGVVLVTQNPVDIDYKGLTNTGTWFIGKLQTERDKDRVIEGLSTAISEMGGNVEYNMSDLISQLKSRVFLLHNVHNDDPFVFHTRWAMNYLRGPLTRPQIANLMSDKSELKDVVPLEESKLSIGSTEYFDTPPTTSSSVPQYFLKADDTKFNQTLFQQNIEIESKEPVSIPRIYARYKLRFYNKKLEIDKIAEHAVIFPEIDNGRINLSAKNSINTRNLLQKPLIESKYSALEANYNSQKELQRFKKELTDHLYYNSKITVSQHKKLKLFQKSNEEKREFIVRVQQSAREQRDAEIDKIEKKYESKLDRLEDKIVKISREISSDQEEHKARKREELLGIGESVVGILLGRRRTSMATSASRRRRMTDRIKRDIEDSIEEIEEMRKNYKELDDELKENIEEIKKAWLNAADNIEELQISPRRSDVDVDEIAIVWIPLYLIKGYKSGYQIQDLIKSY